MLHEKDRKMTQEECQFCHIQEASKQIEEEISSKGFYRRNGRLSLIKRVNNNFLVSINL
jgi:hypothetical protein